MSKWEIVEDVIDELAGIASEEIVNRRAGVLAQKAFTALRELQEQYGGKPTVAEAVSDYCNNICRKTNIERDCVPCPLMNLRSKPTVEGKSVPSD